MTEATNNEATCQYIIPRFDDINQSFTPYIRSDEWTVYEVSKTILLIPLAIIRGVGCVLIVIGAWIVSKAAISGLSSSGANLSIELPLWRKLLFQLTRYIIKPMLFCFGVHSFKKKKLSYKDLYLLYGYVRPDLIDVSMNDARYNIEPSSHIIVSNHIGYLDIVLYTSSRYNGSFISKQAIRSVIGVGDIAHCLQSLFLAKGKRSSKQVVDRVNMVHDTHDNKICNGCCLCTSKLVVFPEGTTTNGKVLLPFRTSVFRAGKPVRPIIIKTEYNHFSTTWESIPFKVAIFRAYTQFFNRMSVVEAPPYIPSKQEIDDPYLYSFNVNQLMSKMLGYGEKIYLLNREHKVKCYHPYLLKQCTKEYALKKGRELFEKDVLIQKYLKLIAEQKEQHIMTI